MAIYRLKNSIKSYSWGSTHTIPSLLDQDNPTHVPIAEYWMSAHPSSPSHAIDITSGIDTPLNELILKNPEKMLGADCIHTFGRELPFLFKILAAERPLSVQAHPSRYKAERGFEREQRAGILLGSHERNYKDKNHKLELFVALTEFELMFGFRPIDEIIYLFKYFCPDKLTIQRDRLEKSPSKLSLSIFFYSLFNIDSTETESIIETLLEGTKNVLNSISEAKARECAILIERLHKQFPHDIGIIFPLLLNIVYLAPNEGLFIDSGELHCYIHGSGLELETNSDNEIRGALTQKHVDVPELISVLTFNPMIPEIIYPKIITQNKIRYTSKANEFELYKLEVENQEETFHINCIPKIVFCSAGYMEVKEQNQVVMLKKGESLFISADTDNITFTGSGTLLIATVKVAQ